DAAGLLAGRGQAFLAEDGASLLHVAVRLDQRGLDVHHAGAGLLAQLLDHFCGDLCHVYLLKWTTGRPGFSPAASLKAGLPEVRDRAQETAGAAVIASAGTGSAAIGVSATGSSGLSSVPMYRSSAML